MTKGHIRLNLKKLYSADGHAVRELLKVATVLRKATQASHNVESGVSGADSGEVLQSKLGDIRATRALASEITQRGMQLYDLLESEPTHNTERKKVTSRPIGADTVEKSIREQTRVLGDRTRRIEKQIQELEKESEGVSLKLNKRQSELDRNSQRLRTMKGVRPAFMDEYDRLECELKRLHEDYIIRFRNVEYLEHELETVRLAEEAEAEEADRQLQRMQKKLREEEARIMRGDDFGEEPSSRGDMLAPVGDDSESDDGVPHQFSHKVVDDDLGGFIGNDDGNGDDDLDAF